MRTYSFKASLVYALAAYILIICQPVRAELESVTPLQVSAMWDLLDSNEFNCAAIIAQLSQDPKLKGLFKASAGVWEGYSIEGHTLMVCDVFKEQFGPFRSQYKIVVPNGIQLFQTLKFAIVLHDIGKPLAIHAGSKFRQHEFTIPILERLFSAYDFAEPEIKLAKALAGNDIMGDIVKGRVDVPTTLSRLTKAALEADVPLKDYALLQMLFYAIDAGSYPALKSVFSTNSAGLMIPKGDRIKNLYEALAASGASCEEITAGKRRP